ncbi:MAG: ribonuclease HII [Bacilli bacterium]|nr:ribonuclease HII [Bacilli bacterium]MBR1817235.1 ribonuclease HII [Bacilli bacterium]
MTSQRIDLLKREKELYNEGYEFICGCDEAGRGPLCGPVVAGAVILPKNYQLEGLNDSKKLSEKKREHFFEIIKTEAIAYGIGIVDAKTIDEINIYEASRLAMKKAIEQLKVTPDYVLTDAMPLPGYPIPSEAIIHGDALSLTIAAASVLAKVTRDHILYEMDKVHPELELSKHKGYPTKRHLELLRIYGPTDDYRFTYRPVRDLIVNSGKKSKEI